MSLFYPARNSADSQGIIGTESQRAAKSSGKNSWYLLFILDEGDAIPDEVYGGIEKSGRIKPGATIIESSTGNTGFGGKRLFC
ncbi:MAG: hypothetical protein HN366_28605 [Deltaproteobacteria bacterium]|jgi:hypothetical protein|nr:hypothetical protein [Deltaproteobacteria bacterium]